MGNHEQAGFAIVMSRWRMTTEVESRRVPSESGKNDCSTMDDAVLTTEEFELAFLRHRHALFLSRPILRESFTSSIKLIEDVAKVRG